MYVPLQLVQRLEALKPSLVCFDGNISSDAIDAVLDHCKSADVTSELRRINVPPC